MHESEYGDERDWDNDDLPRDPRTAEIHRRYGGEYLRWRMRTEGAVPEPRFPLSSGAAPILPERK